MTPYERRSRITEYLTENPLTVPQIAALTKTQSNTIRNDLQSLTKMGITYASGWDGPLRQFTARMTASPEQLEPKDAYVKKSRANRLDLPPELKLLFGYTDHIPQGGVFIDNADFHPAPTRTSRVKVHIGNAWGQIMDMAL